VADDEVLELDNDVDEVELDQVVDEDVVVVVLARIAASESEWKIR
jgi:hypothetical protein